MANTRITSSFITKESLRYLHSNLFITKGIDHSWNSMFGKSVGPVGRSGATVNIRKPALGTVRSGWTMNQSDVTETSIPLTIDKVYGVDLNFSDADMALSVEDFSARYIQPNASLLASTVEMITAQYMKDRIYNYVNSSAFGTAPNASSYFLGAAQKIKENLSPAGTQLTAAISPRTEAAMVGALAGQMNPQGNISTMFEKGQMSKAVGLDWYSSQVLPAHTHGTATTGTTPAVSGYTSSTVTVSGSTSGGTYKAGDVFYIADVYAINKETKQTYGSLQQFTCTEDKAASGTNVTLTVSPEIIISGPNQTVSAAPTGKGVTWNFNTSGLVTQNDLVFAKDSFAIAFADLPVPGGMDMASSISEDGISLRFVRGWDIVESRFISRLDVFFGLAAVRPEWACRVIS